MLTQRETKLKHFASQEIAGYPGLFNNFLAQFQNRPNKETPMIKYVHTCRLCTKLDCFTPEFDQESPENWYVLPKKDSQFRKEEDYIKDEYDQHVFNLCCLAFSVGEWGKFCQIYPLKKYTAEQIEYTAHLALGVWDLSHFIGLHVWPPRIYVQMQRLIDKQRKVAPETNWPADDDTLSVLFIEPLQFAESQISELQAAINIGMRREYGASSSEVDNALLQLGLEVTTYPMYAGKTNYLTSAHPSLSYLELGYKGKSPVISKKHLLKSILDRAEIVPNFDGNIEDAVEKELAFIEQDIKEAKYDHAVIMQLFRKQIMRRKKIETNAFSAFARGITSVLMEPLTRLHDEQ